MVIVCLHSAYSEQYRAKIAELRAREISHDACLKDMSLFSDREVRGDIAICVHICALSLW